MTKKMRTAIIGAGFVGRVHLEGVRRLGNVEVPLIGGSQIESARKMAANLSVERAESDFLKIASDPNVDAIHICTPNVHHFKMAAAALEAGKHVVCEKPLATSSDEARRLVALA